MMKICDKDLKAPIYLNDLEGGSVFEFKNPDQHGSGYYMVINNGAIVNLWEGKVYHSNEARRNAQVILYPNACLKLGHAVAYAL